MSVRKIHLPQTLNEEAIADEFSDWEQVSFRTAERFAPGIQPSLADDAPDSPGYWMAAGLWKGKEKIPLLLVIGISGRGFVFVFSFLLW